MTTLSPNRNAANPNYDLLDPSDLDRSFDQRFVEVVLGITQPLKDTLTITPVPEGDLQQASEPASQTAPASTNPDSAEILNADTDAIIVDSPTAQDNTTTPSSSLRITSSLLKPKKTEYRVQKFRQVDYDVEAFQRHHNTTSHFKRCIDGLFFNHNEQALKELQKIITVADRGMDLLTAEIGRIHNVNNITRDE
jgi:hypothetical protein